jgi:cytochrome P450
MKNSGVHSCIGKPLAMTEMRLTVARVARKFDIHLGESYNDKEFLSAWKDFLTVKLGPLPLKFVPRNDRRL